MLSKIKFPNPNYIMANMFFAAMLRCIIQLVKIGRIEIAPVIEAALVMLFISLMVWAFSEFFQELFGRIDDDDE